MSCTEHEGITACWSIVRFWHKLRTYPRRTHTPLTNISSWPVSILFCTDTTPEAMMRVRFNWNQRSATYSFLLLNAAVQTFFVYNSAATHAIHLCY